MYMLHCIKRTARRLWDDESGASLLEYSILVGLIVAGVVATITGVGTWIGGRWNILNTTIHTTPS
jgi:pilus assembly protein Flp/PilA